MDGITSMFPKIGFEEYGKPVLRAQLEITEQRTAGEVIETGDGKWKAAPGPTLKNDLHTGEVMMPASNTPAGILPDLMTRSGLWPERLIRSCPRDWALPLARLLP